MNYQELLERIVYLDAAYVAAQYEFVKDVSANTQITREQSKSASAGISAFGGALSSTESKTYSISTIKMLSEIFNELEALQRLQLDNLELGKPSSVGWINAILTLYKTSLRSGIQGEQHTEKVPAEETYYGLQLDGNATIALVTTPAYFSSGIDAFVELRDTVIDEIGIPVKAFVRVYSARSAFGQWIGVPRIMVEDGAG